MKNRRLYWTPEMLREVLESRETAKQIAERWGCSAYTISGGIGRARKKFPGISHISGKTPDVAPPVPEPPARSPRLSIVEPPSWSPRLSIAPDLPAELQTGIYTNLFTVPCEGERGVFVLKFMSDLHLEAAAVHRERILQELDEARSLRARIILNGDICDLIIPADIKRFQRSVGVPEISSIDDALGAILRYAVDFLAPYAPLIDVIGVGNHEDAILRHHNLDFCRMLVDALNAKGGRIKYGGYAGVIVHRLIDPDGKPLATVKGAYVHGARGNTPVTKGIMEFARRLEYIEGVDYVILGDNHQKTSHSVARYQVQDNGELEWKEVRCIRTASYYLHQKDNWGARRGFAPQPHGGALMKVHYDGRNKSLRVET